MMTCLQKSEEGSRSLELLESQMVVSAMWVLGTEAWSSGRATSPLRHWATSLVPRTYYWPVKVFTCLSFLLTSLLFKDSVVVQPSLPQNSGDDPASVLRSQLYHHGQHLFLSKVERKRYKRLIWPVILKDRQGSVEKTSPKSVLLRLGLLIFLVAIFPLEGWKKCLLMLNLRGEKMSPKVIGAYKSQELDALGTKYTKQGLGLGAGGGGGVEAEGQRTVAWTHNYFNLQKHLCCYTYDII